MKNMLAYVAKLREDYRCLVEQTEWFGYDDFDPQWSDNNPPPPPPLVERLFGRRVYIRVDAVWTIVRYRVGAAWCDRFGHPARAIEAEDFVDAQYEQVPDDGLDHGRRRMVDCDGGGVVWHCRLCGRGGSARF